MQLSVTMMSWVQVWVDLIVYKQIQKCLSDSHSLNFHVLISILSKNWVVNNLESQPKLELNSSLWQIIAAIVFKIEIE